MLPVFTIDFAAGHRRYEIPLLRGVVQTDGSALNGSYSVMDNLNSRVLLVVETTIETIAEHQHVYALTLEVFKVVQLKILGTTCKSSQQC